MKNSAQLIDQFVGESLRVKAKFFEENKEAIVRTAETIAHGLRNGHKVLFFGNGGSAADAQHMATEYVVRYMRNRRAYPAVALTTDTSLLTAAGNDLGFEQVFARQVQALLLGEALIGDLRGGPQHVDLEAGVKLLEFATERLCGDVVGMGRVPG